MKFVVANVERLLTKMLCKSKGGLSCFGKCNDDVEGLGALVSAVPQSGEFHKMISIGRLVYIFSGRVMLGVAIRESDLINKFLQVLQPMPFSLLHIRISGSCLRIILSLALLIVTMSKGSSAAGLNNRLQRLMH